MIDSVGEEHMERVRDRVVERECESCGDWFRYAGVGRPGRFCSSRCRQRAWALRRAAEQLGTLDGVGPQVVREIRERVIERARIVPGPPEPAPPPTAPRDWMKLLTLLADRRRQPRGRGARRSPAAATQPRR